MPPGITGKIVFEPEANLEKPASAEKRGQAFLSKCFTSNPVTLIGNQTKTAVCSVMNPWIETSFQKQADLEVIVCYSNQITFHVF